MLLHSAVIEGWSDEETLAGLKARKGPPDAQRALFANELRNSGGDLSQSLAAPASLANVPCPLVYVCMNIYYSRVCDAPSEANPEPKGRIDAFASYVAVEKHLDSGVHAVLLCEVGFGSADLSDEDGGKGDYSFDFFPKADFDTSGEALDAFVDKNSSCRFVMAPGAPSSMYRRAFGNVLILNETLIASSTGATILETWAVPALLPPTPKDAEGRSAAFATLRTKGGAKVTLAGTHLTEKQLPGASGLRQRQMLAVLVDAIDAKHGAGSCAIIAGDLNIPDVAAFPPSIGEFCMQSPFLHAAPENDPYELLRSRGFASVQSAASSADLMLRTCWNGVAVDYIGARHAAVPVAVAALPPLSAGVILSDHAWPAAVYSMEEVPAPWKKQRARGPGTCTVL